MFNRTSLTKKSDWNHHSLVNIEDLTPSMRHYVELKRAHPNQILMYRLGDFFECFFEDAIQLSILLELALTSKDSGKKIGRVPMAGVPHHAMERYCKELVKHGLTVALCDQMETSPSKGALLRREITRVFTPGTIIEEGMLPSRQNNWLVSVVLHEKDWGLAIADVSTGEFRVTERTGLDKLFQELAQLETAEVLWSGEEEPQWCPENLWLTHLLRTPFERPQAETTLLETFHLNSLEGLGLKDLPLALRAAGGLVYYLNTTRRMDEVITDYPANLLLEKPNIYFSGNQLILDIQTRRNLELVRTQRSNEFQGSLLWSIDQTLTAMGGRCLRHWIEAPLMCLEEIQQRQETIGELIRKRPLRVKLRQFLKSINDLERLAGRSSAGTASPKDLVNLADSLASVPQLVILLENCSAELLLQLNHVDPLLDDLVKLIHNTLVNDPPLLITEGGLINSKIDAVLDALRNKLDEQNTWLEKQEQAERIASGNPNVKLQYHKNLGYYLSVTRSKAVSVPDHWIRRQILTNEERFITPDIKDREAKILKMQILMKQREHELFVELRRKIGEHATSIRNVARKIAILDSLAGLAELAANRGYCCPKVVDSRILKIEQGRHPVVEQLLVNKQFIPNSIHLGNGDDLAILTGPNASGKSCFLRQIGVIQLMSQVGSWVPADSAIVGLTDRIFTRVGAVDDLSAGQSTFMVEMTETANILHHATPTSLVLLDEIGRGTATFDGLSIASAVAEYLANELKSRTIFATHYHELNHLATTTHNIKNLQVLVEETGDNLIFLYKVVDGGASRSYGIEVARLAGVPKKVIQRARQILQTIENNSKLSGTYD
uniref:DNA mismatch repair protein n=1 Tax=Paulinella micropora TaxID=1928728 RepID=A0A385I0L0_9EUKA|nr:DNA mismatch repair protein [Paulinella micropora]AXY63424.1 DNA mismatch repair protein [Paulinella micropora]